jgi:hypothetical protein
MVMDFAQQKASFILASGNPITILRSSGNVSTIGRIMAMKRRTGFFSINYLREALFAPDSGIQRGDLIRDESTGELYFVEGFQEKTMQRVVISINAELYMVNYPAVQIQRLQTVADANLNKKTSWVQVATVPANVEHVNGNIAYKDGLLLPTTVFRITMQTQVVVQMLDRFVIDGKNYKADDINLSVIPGLQVIQVSVDPR